MGIRMDQFMGLNKWATELVKGERVLVCTEKGMRVFPDGREEPFSHEVHGSSVRKEKSGKTFSGFNPGYPLYKYTLPDGTVYEERVQAEPWSSGPVFFLALVDEIGQWVPESLWTDEEIDAA